MSDAGLWHVILPRARNRTKCAEDRTTASNVVRVENSRRFLPQSLIGKAVHYALEQSQWLLAFLYNGELEIDNNLVENAIRPTAIGKKNWLFIGGTSAGLRGAIIYTIIESFRRQDIDHYEYLRDVVSRLPG